MAITMMTMAIIRMMTMMMIVAVFILVIPI